MAENHHSDRKAPQPAVSWLPELKWLLLLAALTGGFFWKLVLTDQYIWFDHPDMAYLEIPRLQHVAREIHAGRFPLWDPHLWAGQPLIGQTQPGPVYPLNLALASLNLRGGYLRFSHLNAYWVALHFLAAAFFYLLARDWGLSRAVSVFGACVFSFGGFLGSVNWLDVANGAIWAPAVFLFVLRACRTGRLWRNAAAGGLLLGIAWLSGHHEIPLLISFSSAATWLWFARRNRKLLGAAALFATVAVLVSGVQLLPMIEFGQHSRRWVGLPESIGWKDKIPYTAHTGYSMPPRGFFGLVMTEFSPFPDTSLYVGWIAAALAAAGVAAGWGQLAGRWAVAMAALTLAYSLGAFTPLNGLFYALLPMINKARVPIRGVALFNLALALLACYGLEAILRNALARRTRYVWMFLAAAGALVLAVGAATERLNGQQTALGAMAAVVGAAVLAGWRSGALNRTTTWAALLALVLVELTSGGVSRYPNRQDKDGFYFASRMTANQDIAYHLMSVKDRPVRAAIDDEAIPANFGDWHCIDMLHGYVAGASENLLRHELHLPRVQDLFAVTHWIGKEPNRQDQQVVYHADSGLRVFRNPTALARVRSVHQTRSAKDDDELRALIRDPAVDLATTAVFLGEAPKLEECSVSDRIRLEDRSHPDKMAIEADMGCRGLVVIADTYFPGWTAYVDGRPAPIVETYGALRGIVVEAGRHRIGLRYRPRSVYYGLAMTVAGLLIAGAVILLSRFR
jgi:hypothetical protein